jgi:hypothetical protein
MKGILRENPDRIKSLASAGQGINLSPQAGADEHPAALEVSPLITKTCPT